MGPQRRASSCLSKESSLAIRSLTPLLTTWCVDSLCALLSSICLSFLEFIMLYFAQGAVDFWWHHAMISDEAAAGIRANCNFSRIGPLDAPLPQHKNPESKEEKCDDFCNM